MLETLLAIGRIFRDSPDGLKHHRYVKRAPQRDSNPKNANAPGNFTRFFQVPVEEEGSFDFSQCVECINENLRPKFFYLNYKTSDAESYKKYIFGDIYKLRQVKGKEIVEDGNFRFGDPAKTNLYGQNSFNRAVADAGALENERIQNFRASFARYMEDIEAFLAQHPNVYLHFDFDGRHWYELSDVMDTINAKLLSAFTAEIKDAAKNVEGYVLRKALYKTLTSAAEGPSGRVPGFMAENEYKNKLFADVDDVMNLLYVVDFSTKAVIRKGEVKIIVLPRGEDLKAQAIENFFTFQPVESKLPEKKAQKIRDSNTDDDIDPDDLFQPTMQGATDKMTQFDFIFSKASSSPSTPDVDLIEVPGVYQGLLEHLSKRVVAIRKDVESRRSYSEKNLRLNITQSLLNILDDRTKAKKKYHNHLFKVLPQIYTGTYYRDDVLLPALIEKAEYAERNDEKPDFNLLKFDFEFLTRIQNNPEDRMSSIKQSPSYQVGYHLGQMARPFVHKETPIKSFKTNYVGLLSRRITTLPDVLALGAEIGQKLEMHEEHFRKRGVFIPKVATRNFFNVATDFPQGINYNRHECAFGFFHGYTEFIERAATPEKTGDSDSTEADED